MHDCLPRIRRVEFVCVCVVVEVEGTAEGILTLTQVLHIETFLQSAVSTLKNDLHARIILLNVKKALAYLYFFKPITAVLGGTKPRIQSRCPCKLVLWWYCQ